MKAFQITSKISIIAAVNHSHIATLDKEADFDQIILRVRNGDKFVNFRITDLGETVTAQMFKNNKFDYEIRLTNDIRHEKAFQTILANYLQ